jgi:ankyrin repeat protein
VKAVVEALLKAGAPLDARTKEGLTPLMQAVAAQHEDAARWLLDVGADLRPTDNVGGTALTLALWYERCSRDFARLLIQRGSPINLWDALWVGDTPQALTLTEKVNIRQSGPNSYTYLHLAAQIGNLAVAERLLTRGAPVNARDTDGYTPLHYAMGGSPGQVIPAGRPYWHAYGPTTGREPLLKLLLKAGARRDARAEEYTPLSCAILARRPELVRVLLEAGANLNGKGRYDEPILFFAIETGNPEVVKVLLDAGANPRQKGTYGGSALERAETRNDPQILALIKAALEKSPEKRR